MSDMKRALLLVGSARTPQSTSESLGSYLLKRLGEHGYEGETVLLHRALAKEEARGDLLEKVDRADMVVLAFPLYVDSLPATVVSTLELIQGHRARQTAGRHQRLLAIVNCGFPESYHNDTAAAICRKFAEETGFEWAGALLLGGGGMIAGRELEEAGGVARLIIEALDAAALAIAAGQAVPAKAIEVMAKQPIPAWAYRAMGWLGWRLQARQNGVLRQLYARPYEG
jgi:NAD(P)H-dependent FMN reductase